MADEGVWPGCHEPVVFLEANLECERLAQRFVALQPDNRACDTAHPRDEEWRGDGNIRGG